MPKLKIADAEINYVIVGEQGEWLDLVDGLISAFLQNWEKYFPKSSPQLSNSGLDKRFWQWRSAVRQAFMRERHDCFAHLRWRYALKSLSLRCQLSAPTVWLGSQRWRRCACG